MRFGIVLILMLLVPGVYASALTTEELLKMLSIPPEQWEDLEAGKIISYSIPERTETELATGVAMYLPDIDVAGLSGKLQAMNFAISDPNQIIKGEIPANASGPEVLKGFAYTAKDAEEAQSFWNAEAGDHFNLSNEELALIAARREAQGVLSGKALLDAASALYREILFSRYLSYRKSGLAGIPDYVRRNSVSHPAEELKGAVARARVFERFAPETFNLWQHYPAALPPGTEEHFYYTNRLVEERATPILTHLVAQTSPEYYLVISREYYVGHSYNSGQLAAGAGPLGKGVVVSYGYRSYTDQIAGFGAAMRHSIGRGQLQTEITRRLMQLGKQLGRK